MITPGYELLNTIAAAPAAPRGAALREAAEGFEALFLNQLLEPIESAGGSLFGAGPEGRTFAGMFRQVLAEQLARSRPLGIADQVERTLAQRHSPTNRGPAEPGVAPGRSHG